MVYGNEEVNTHKNSSTYCIIWSEGISFARSTPDSYTKMLYTLLSTYNRVQYVLDICSHIWIKSFHESNSEKEFRFENFVIPTIIYTVHHICDVTIYIQKATYIIVVIDIAFEYLLLVWVEGKPHGFLL